MQQRRIYSRLWHRPTRVVTILVGLAAACISILAERLGIRWKYSEVGFGTAILLWLLLTAFRPEWRRLRFWLALCVILAVHLWGWLFIAGRIDRFGFALMFALVVVELVAGASLISKIIPEDEQAMLDAINRW